MNRTIVLLMILVLVATPLVGCMMHRHTIGNGGTTQNMKEMRQWYILWGLIPLNTVDGGMLAQGQSNFTIESKITVLDFIINIFTSMVTVYSRSVIVTY